MPIPSNSSTSIEPTVLVLFAHPAPQRSRINWRLAEAIRHLPGITFHDLYAAYPDLDIDIAHEQQLLARHSTIVWQHPFYWYSTPPILKEWQDIVLQFGWAYGPGGHALSQKLLVSAITTGGPETAYQQEGFNRYSIRQLLAPIDQTAHLCGMQYLPPWVNHSVHRYTESELEMAASKYRQLLGALRDGKISPAAVRDLPYLNLFFENNP